MVEAAASEAAQWMLDNRSLALPARVFRLKDVLDAMPEWLQRRPGTRKATAEALRDHFKAKQWPVPMTGRTQWRPIRAVAAPGLLNGDRAVEPPEKPMTPDRIRWEHIQ